MENKLNIKEGTVEFWVRENRINWNDGKAYPLFELSEGGNSIFVVKDTDDKLKFFHICLGRGRTDVECETASLNNDKAHHIVATWDIKSKKICLYVDGGEFKNCKKIEY